MEFLQVDRAGQHRALRAFGRKLGPAVQDAMIVEQQPLSGLELEGEPQIRVVDQAEDPTQRAIAGPDLIGRQIEGRNLALVQPDSRDFAVAVDF